MNVIDCHFLYSKTVLSFELKSLVDFSLRKPLRLHAIELSRNGLYWIILMHFLQNQPDCWWNISQPTECNQPISMVNHGFYVKS